MMLTCVLTLYCIFLSYSFLAFHDTLKYPWILLTSVPFDFIGGPWSDIEQFGGSDFDRRLWNQSHTFRNYCWASKYHASYIASSISIDQSNCCMNMGIHYAVSSNRYVNQTGIFSSNFWWTNSYGREDSKLKVEM